MPGSFSDKEPEDDGITYDQLCGCCGALPGDVHDDDCANAPMGEEEIEAMLKSMEKEHSAQ